MPHWGASPGADRDAPPESTRAPAREPTTMSGPRADHDVGPGRQTTALGPGDSQGAGPESRLRCQAREPTKVQCPRADPGAGPERSLWCQLESRTGAAPESNQGSAGREGRRAGRERSERGPAGSIFARRQDRLHRSAGGIGALCEKTARGLECGVGAGYGRGAACGTQCPNATPRPPAPPAGLGNTQRHSSTVVAGLPADRDACRPGRHDRWVAGRPSVDRSLSIRMSRFRYLTVSGHQPGFWPQSRSRRAFLDAGLTNAE